MVVIVTSMFSRGTFDVSGGTIVDVVKTIGGLVFLNAKTNRPVRLTDVGVGAVFAGYSVDAIWCSFRI